MATIETAAITGATGMVGSALTSALQKKGARVLKISRRSGVDFVTWDPAKKELDPRQLEGVDAVFNLAGEPIAQSWNSDTRRKIRQSRVDGTQLLAETLAELEQKPHVLVSASGINFYGHDRPETVSEDAEAGEGFLADVCREWEAAAQPAVDAGIRSVLARIGVVLSKQGGALARMLPAFKLGLGGKVGSGKQMMSWVSLADVVNALIFCAENEDLSGPVNLSAPQSVKNESFAMALGKALGRPSIMPAPAFAVKTVFGQMADETLLANIDATPKRLTDADFVFQTPRLEDALRHEFNHAGA